MKIFSKKAFEIYKPKIEAPLHTLDVTSNHAISILAEARVGCEKLVFYCTSVDAEHNLWQHTSEFHALAAEIQLPVSVMHVMHASLELETGLIFDPDEKESTAWRMFQKYHYIDIAAIYLQPFEMNDTMVTLVEDGPVWDGDMPSKTQRDELIKLGYAVCVVVKGDDGYTAATIKGRDWYKQVFGRSDTIAEAKAWRLARTTLKGFKK